jgi:hypothetical protein
VELGWFGTTWDRYKDEMRNVTQWQMFLEAMLASQSFTEKDVARMGDATLTAKGMFTPFKKKRKTEEDLVSDDEESANSYQDVEPPGYSPLRPGVDIAQQWEKIVQSMDWLRRMALASKKGNDEMEETLADVMMRLEARVGELRALVGPRSAGLGTATVFGLVEAHVETIKAVEALCRQRADDLVKLATQYTPTDITKMKESTKQEIYADVAKALDLLRLYSTY